MPKRQQQDPLTEALRKQLPKLRRQRGWTQADLASFLEANGLPWTRAQVNSLESEVRGLNPTEWFALLQVLHIGERDLFPDGVALTPGLVWEAGGLVEILKQRETPKALERARLDAIERRLGGA